ncbi:NAD(P)H-dependent oxidoreductase [Colwellia sp. MSW7]|uniref:NAD(P)H-dependent oxidoreductase n=1 Tax=Colwellia maritima TaxID=2912588 RepID=A0ABS9X240_9GAMM|nr:NAD(P)H-dependent oxidoreductase [Colwellia maritima]MCI2283112.1 NAD(P)H-dependent oxidoreductase [Colwellia maritima]
MDSLLKTAIILGTARAEGNTHKLVKCYQAYQAADVFFLSDYAISMFDYEHRNQEDDFINLAKMLLHYDYLIFATPMYWYSMSGQMKVFLTVYPIF